MFQITSIIGHYPYLGLFSLLVLGGIGLPFPEDTTLILCGFLLSHGVIKPISALLVVYVGVMLADLFLFFVGRRYGRMVVMNKRLRKIISPKKLSLLEKQFRRRGILVLLLGRHLVGLRAQILLTAGVVNMRPLKFLIADGISAIVTMALMIGAGYIGGNSLQIIRKDITRFEHVAIFLAVVFLALYLVFKHFSLSRQASR
jgi:membrane protein DedA with SNARE-associated domain